MKNRKGFTLAEILGVIIIIVLLLIIIAPTITSRINSLKDKSKEAGYELVYMAVSQHITENKSKYPPGKRYCIKISDIINEGKLTSPVKEIDTGKTIDDYTVLVTIYSLGNENYEIVANYEECQAETNLPIIDFVVTPASNVWTNGNKTVTIIYPDDTTLNKYKKNDSSWVSSGLRRKNVVFEENGKLTAKAQYEGITIESTINIEKIDKNKPEINFNENINTNNSANITITDKESGLLENQTLSYAWTTSSSTPTSGWKTKQMTNNRGEKSVIVTIPTDNSDNLNGTYYLHIKSGIKDLSGNQSDSSKANLKLNNPQSEDSSNDEGSTSDTIVINSLDLTPSETSITAKINSTPEAYKYYYSIDENVWYESSSNEYTINDLKPYTDYTVYVKAEDSSGEVVKYSKTVKTKDETNPSLEIKKGNFVLDEKDTANHINYDYYKGLELNVTATDNDQIQSVKYCTSSEACTPNTNLTLKDGKGTVQMPSAKGGQILCVKATDRKGNITNKCSNKYKVDGVIPTLTGMNYSSSGNSVTIILSGENDNHSGIYKYLYSKDGGATFIQSDNSNYTFTNLEDGSYVFVSKVVDNAGNESDILNQSVAVRISGICGNTITDFGNCIIANEAGLTIDDENATASKAAIQAKGTPSFEVTSPSITYRQNWDTSTSTARSTTYVFMSKNYTFNASTGYYTLSGASQIDPTTVDAVNNTYYTCGNNITYCTTLYKLAANVTQNGSTYTFTKYNGTAVISGYDIESPGTGMYGDTDYDGNPTYYFRGTGLANYVHFAGKYWRIIRVNGDGTVRMIYDGTSKHKDGESSTDRRVTTSAFNSWWSDNAYVGYMYGTPDSSHNTITEAKYTVSNNGLSATNSYYFGTSYSFNESTNTFTLAGKKTAYTIAEYYASHNNEKLYTCFSTSPTAGCQRLSRVKGRDSEVSMTVWPVEWSSSSKEYAHSNMTPSTMKNYLEGSGETNGWFANNLSGYTSKISNSSVFCNNREISTYTNGTYTNQGYGIYPTMYGYTRFWVWNGSNISPTLACPNESDRFTVDSSAGNGLLNAPVGLITADEVAMAGGKTGTQNTLYYLYAGHVYWTMSPSLFGNGAHAHEMLVTDSGALSSRDAYADTGVHPVINLKSKNLSFSGLGTYEKPYEVS